MKVNKKIDKQYFGFVLGILLPILSLFTIYKIKFAIYMDFIAFIKAMLSAGLYSKVMALAVYFGNIAVFMLFAKLNYLRFTRGMLGATILYTFFIVIVKFL
ncbi:MAG: hypothetical protein N4A49_09050 [Marinifilaceae bacterium]|jgi:hypothetical protein|nr:hypothetical protein [Marinifilaceae bacterium]